MDDEIQIAIDNESDIVGARQKGRELAAKAGFAGSDLTVIATAISEIARNIVTYAGRGELHLRTLQKGAKRGIQVIAKDSGPGIADLDLALRDGYSTGKSLGLGLPGAKRLMDEFEITSAVGHGTTVTMRKWTH